MMNDAEMAERLFGDSPIHGDAERTIARDAIENELATPQEAEARAQAWSDIYRDLGLNATESQNLAGLKGNPSAAQREVWREDARTALKQEYGDDAGQALKDAATYLAKHPKLHQELSRTGLGDHPRWVRTIAAKARQAKAQGKL